MMTFRFDRLVEINGAICGIIGSYLIAMNTPVGRYGFWAFLVSNIFWIVFALRKRHPWLLTQNLIFLGSSVIGIARS